MTRKSSGSASKGKGADVAPACSVPPTRPALLALTFAPPVANPLLPCKLHLVGALLADGSASL